MKKIGIIVLFYGFSISGKAQIFDRIKNKVNQKVNDAVDKTIDNVGKKKKDSTANNLPKAVDSTVTQTTSTTVNSTTGAPASPGVSAPPEDIKAYSKFDFVPGEKIIVEENFSQDAIGEFPDKWNTKTSAEVVTVSNKPGKWLCLKQDGVFYPEYISTLPDNFTLQVDVMVSNGISNIGALTIALAATKEDREKFDNGYVNSDISVPGIKIDINPQSGTYEGSFSYSSNALGHGNINNLTSEFHAPDKTFATISIWRQKQRVRVYVNSTKMLDLPRAIEPGAIINSLIFGAYAPDYEKKGGAFYIGNIRLAVGAPDTRNKLITEGKFVTHGILFDVNSDKIKPESNGALQDIANVLKDNSTIRVKIVGHTDSDGDDKMNLDLSKKRADAVKAALVASFGIDGARLDTDGKGKTQPIDVNTTPVGKANNRRVEFIKL
ncbi:OmpA family protein [Chitinophagaceae bacterium LWZ2-11]